MKKNYEFKTQRGAEIKLEVEIKHITEMGNIADHNFTNKVSVYKYSVSSISVNGKEYNGKFTSLSYQNIQIGMQGNQPILVAVPQEVIDDFKFDEAKESKEWTNKFLESAKRFNDHEKMMEKAMNN